jgi:hypothetical protein
LLCVLSLEILLFEVVILFKRFQLVVLRH